MRIVTVSDRKRIKVPNRVWAIACQMFPNPPWFYDRSGTKKDREYRSNRWHRHKETLNTRRGKLCQIILKYYPSL